MSLLKYSFTNDTLFKMFFVKYPDLLKRLVAKILKIPLESIEEFIITNPEMPPEVIGDKFCRLDINMIVNGQRVDLEIQKAKKGFFTERALYYLARGYSTSLKEGEDYSRLPRTIVICIVAFELFDCEDFHSEFEMIETTRHTPLNDKMRLHFFELPKLPKDLNVENELNLWLSLFKAETEEELKKIEELGVSVMTQAIGAYRHVSASDEFIEIERLRSKAGHDRAQEIYDAKREVDEKWQSVVADKDTALAEQAALIAELRVRLGEN